LRARDVLEQLIKLDSKNIDARRLLATVQSNLAQRQRNEQVKELHLRADEALRDKLYDQAISLMEQVLEIDPSNDSAPAKLEAARQGKAALAELETCLQKAGEAKEAGDFAEAKAQLKKAMALEKGDPRAKVALIALNARIAEVKKERKIAKTLKSAQAEIQARRFDGAIQLLEGAAQIDPGNPDVVRLLQSARTAREDEELRKVVEQVEHEVNSAVTSSQFGSSMEAVERALQQYPADPSLLKFKARLSKQLTELQIRARVDETVRKCYPLMESSPQEALGIVQEELRNFPAEERLLRLQSAIEERLAQLKLEEARSRCMARAHEAIRSQRYGEALQVLETCQAEGIFSNEISDLVEFASNEARRQERNALIETTVARAQALIGQGAYDQVISLLEPLLAQYDDSTLRLVLEKAKAEQQSVQTRLQSALSTARQLASFELWDQAVAFLEQQPEMLHEFEAVKSALSESRAASGVQSRTLQATGAVYAALHRADLPAASERIEAVRQMQDTSGMAPRLAMSLESRITQKADHMVTTAMAHARAALQEGDPTRAAEVLHESDSAKDFSTFELKQDWLKLKRQANKAKVFGRVGIRLKPPAGPQG